MRVPAGEQLTTMCPQPSARSRSVSDGFITGVPSTGPSGRWKRGRVESESRQALRAVVWNPGTGNFRERAVRPRRVAHQLRGIPIDLVETVAIRRQPAVARSAAHGSIDRPEGAISR